MDKYEYGLKKEHLKQLVKKGSMKEAAQVCDSINWNHARDIYGLQIAAEVYQSVDQYGKERQKITMRNLRKVPRRIQEGFCWNTGWLQGKIILQQS